MLKESSSQIDCLLEPLLLMASGEQADEFLSQLIATHAEPVINGIIRYKLHLNSSHGGAQAEADDLRQEAIAQLLTELQKLRHHPEAHPIGDVRGLAATITYRLCARWVRRQFPERHALRNRIQYLLTRQAGFALWPDESKKLMAGFAAWQGQRSSTPTSSLRQLPQDEKLLGSLGSRQPERLNDLLAAIFNHLGRPVEFDELVKTVAALWQIEDRVPKSVDEDRGAVRFVLADREADVAWRVEKRIFLERLWEEVRQLPPPQRAALLLNLRDAEGRGCLALFPATGIATLRQLGESLGLGAEKFAEVWNELPLEDARIAELLQLTRQQVINARKSARERLTRRLKGFF